MSELVAAFDLPAVARAGYGLAALAFALFALYLLLAWRGGRPGAWLLVAVAGGAGWSFASFLGVGGGAAWALEVAVAADVARLAGWYGFVLVLLHEAGVGRQVLRRFGLVAAAVLLVLLASLLGAGATDGDAGAIGRIAMMSSLLAAVFGLVLVEQFYRNLPADGRWAFKPLCVALLASFAFDVFLYAEGLLFQRLDSAVWSVRGFANALVLPLVGLSVARNPGWRMRISISREVVFHTSSLLISGLYLLLVAGAGYYVRFFGGDWARAFQIALVFAGLLALVVVGVSGSLRARLRVWLSKHLFAYRYDYRNQWLGFTRALSLGASRGSPGEAVIRALGDLVESPGGGLWLRDAGGDFRMQARLNMVQCADLEPGDGSLPRFLAGQGWIVNLEEFRSRRGMYRELSLPEWVSRLPDAWLIVPLSASDELIGFVILQSSRVPFEVDWEVLDLLRTAQQQAASFLSQLQAQEALLEAKKFDAFNRMSAFVVHDLKNLVAQLSLVMRNAERHRDNPEFQQDVLDTVAHVEGRMRALMGQLLEKTPIDPRRPVDLARTMARIIAAKAGQAPQLRLVAGEAFVMAHADRLERILGHIVQNAIDATPQDGKVEVEVRRGEAGPVQVLVTDSGCGMSPEFIRDRLFRPFQTTKASGMGIGAYECRQYVREIGGSIEVDSRPDEGTEVRISLPPCEAPGSGPVQEYVSSGS